MRKCFQNYYKNLYLQTYINNYEQIDSLSAELDLPTLTDEQNDKLLAQITKEEIQGPIKRLKKN